MSLYEKIILGLLILCVVLFGIIINEMLSRKSNKDYTYLLRKSNDDLNDLRKIIVESKNDKSILEKISIKNLEQNKLMNKELMTFEDKIIQNMDIKFSQLNTRVNEKLESNFKKTDLTFNNIVDRIGHIDEAQQKLEKLSINIVSLEDILNDKKSRGVFGEISMYNILDNVFGSNTGIYNKQYKLSNGTVADAVLNCPSPLGMVVVDSKFPLENYRRMINVESSSEEVKKSTMLFKQNLKKHINDIKNKYIIPGETSDNAVLFLPSEAIFAEINSKHQDIIDYANSNKIWITSPTTLVAFLNNLQMMLTNIERDKYAVVIATELDKLKVEFSRYNNRWNKLIKDINSVSKDAKDIHVTSSKITKKFDDISNVNLEKNKLS